MRVVTTTLLLAAVAGCGPRREVVPRPPPAERPDLSQTQIDSIAPVIDSLARALAELAPKYPELAAYKAEKAKVRGRCFMGLSYTHSFTRPRVKRGTRPSDYGENGFFISFACSTMYPKGATSAFARSLGMRDTTLDRLRLHIDVRLGAGPKPREDLIREIGSLVDEHIDKLRRIDGDEPNASA